MARGWFAAVLVVSMALPLAAQNADLVITVTPPGAIVSGLSGTFAVTVKNNGPGPASNVQVATAFAADYVDTVRHLDLAWIRSATGCGAIGPFQTSVTCSVAAPIASGASASWVIDVWTSSAFASGHNLTASASATSSTPDPASANNTGITASTTVNAMSSFTVSVCCGGTQVTKYPTYAVRITNLGPSSTPFQINATGPVGFVYSGGTSSDLALTCWPYYDKSSGHCETSALDPPPGANGQNLGGNVATVNIGFVGSGSGNVQLSATTTGGTLPGNPAGGGTIYTSVYPPPAPVDFSVSLRADAYVVAPGAMVRFTAGIENTGFGDPSRDSLKITVPQGLTISSYTGPRCSGPSNGVITCSLGGLPYRTIVTYEFLVESPTTDGYFTVAAEAADPDDASQGDNQASAMIQVLNGGDLSVTASGPTAVVPGGTVVYTAEIRNNGPADVANVMLTDALSDLATLLSVRQTAGPLLACQTPTGPSGVLACSAPALPVGATARLELTERVSATAATASSIVNTMQVQTSSADPDNTNDRTEIRTTVTNEYADVGLSILADPPMVSTGGTVTITINASNAGPRPADVEVTDALPSAFKIASVKSSVGTCTTQSGIACHLGSLAAGATATMTIVAWAPQTANTYTTTATATTTIADPFQSNNTADAKLVVYVPRPRPSRH